MSLIGKRIGHVLINAPIGAGGMGEVFLGFDEKLERKVAVKALRAERRLNSQAKARLIREARLLSKLDHPGLCRIFDLVEQEDADYLILEYVEGRTLGEFIREGVGEPATLRVFAEVAEALAVAHSEGIIHRDLKPDNIMVTPDGRAKILDFGVARSIGSPFVTVDGARENRVAARPRVSNGFQPGKDRTVSLDEDWARTTDGAGLTVRTCAGSLVGTIAYMSPEQAAGGEITRASDLFSFGIMMQETLTGRSTYGDVTGPELLLRVFRAEVLAADGIEGDVATLIRDLLVLDPSARPSAAGTAHRLRWILNTPQRQKRRRVRLAVAGVLAATLLAATGVDIHSRWDAGRRAATARRFAADAEDLEWRMRAEHLSPPHDLRPARAWITRRIQEIEREIDALGRFAEGPGLFAIGRGHMALGDYRAARSSLDSCWASGFRGPEVALALGMTYGQLYSEELKALNGVGDPRLREYERARIERADIHLEIALAATARGLSPDPALASASESVEAGLVRNPSFPALYLKRGEIALYEGRDKMGRGSRSEAGAALAMARKALERARELHKDNAVIALRLAELCHLEGKQLGSRGTSVIEKAEQGLDWAATALTINAQEARALAVRARLHLLLADATGSEAQPPLA